MSHEELFEKAILNLVTAPRKNNCNLFIIGGIGTRRATALLPTPMLMIEMKDVNKNNKQD